MKFQRVTEALASPPCEIIQKINKKEKTRYFLLLLRHYGYGKAKQTKSEMVTFC